MISLAVRAAVLAADWSTFILIISSERKSALPARLAAEQHRNFARDTYQVSMCLGWIIIIIIITLINKLVVSEVMSSNSFVCLNQFNSQRYKTEQIYVDLRGWNDFTPAIDCQYSRQLYV